MLDKDKIKQGLTDEEVITICKDLGSEEPKRDSKGNLIFQTICHNATEGSYKLYYYRDSQMFYCYTGCQESFDIYELVKRSKLNHNFKLGFYDCIRYVASLVNKYIHVSSSINDIKAHLIDDWAWIKKYKRAGKPQADLPIINEKILDVFKDAYHESWIDEGISIETMRKFNIKYYLKEDKIVIPHYNSEGKLIGIRGRALKEDELNAGNKYMPLIIENQMYNHPLGLNLYGLNFTKEAINRIGKVIIFESEKSVMQCHSFFEEDCFAVAICGNQISKWQRDMILSLQPQEVFIAFDKQFSDPGSDKAKEYAQKILKQAYPFSIYATTYIVWDDLNLLPQKASPSDMGLDVLLRLMKQKYEIKSKNGEDLEICNTNS